MGPLAPGVVVAGYRIESVVGRGGMGVVYRALELELDRVVALKVIAPELLEEPVVRERFLREARTAASIEHPNVIPVHAAGERDGIAYLVMRFVEGRDLRTLVRGDGPPAPARAAELIARVADALDAIHQAGYVHRDVKPANVLIDQGGHVYLTDFGLAKQMLTHGGATATGRWVGTLDYVAPEQIRGGAVDARTDVYALGGVLMFVLTGRVPFDGKADEAKLWAQLSDPPPAPSDVRPDLPPEFDDVVARAMAKAPDARYPSAGDLARAAHAAVTGEAVSQPERMVASGAATPAGRVAEISQDASTVTAPTVRTPRRRRRGLPAAATLLAVAVAVLTVVALTGDDDDGRPTTPAPAMKTVHAGHRPNGVALAGGAAWVTSDDRPDVERVDVKTLGKLGSTRVGLGARRIVADGDTVWVAISATREVVRINAKGVITTHLPTGAPPTRLAVGLGSVWVAIASGTDTDLLLRFDRDGRRLHRTPIPHGIAGLTTALGHVWVAQDDVPGVLRIDPRSYEIERWATLSDATTDLAAGGGYLWATHERADSIERVSPVKRNSRVPTAVGHRPLRTVLAGGRLYVTVNTDHAIDVIDPERVRPARRPIDVPHNPYAITADAQSLWVTGTGDDTLTRLPYR